jgi:malonyl CoA-acyl carrier protein transacylase/NAD(P)-dependent dehydrogenase (short-subunit alcohol dehydrogenase family)/acyl carrier protein
LGRRWADRIYPRAPLTPEERAAQAAALTDTRVAQPALGIVDLAAAQLLRSFGVEGAMLGGHSYGELVALCVAGVMQPKDLLELSEARANCILQAARGAPGSMAAVRDSAENVEKALGPDREGVVLANLNAPDQVVIAGPDADVEAACARLSAAGKSCRRLQVACAFHSPVVAKGAEYFAQRLQPVALCAPDRPVFANSTAAPYPADLARLRELLAGQIARPVRFTDEIEAMYAAGARVFVEAGPGSVLTNLVERILGERPHLAVAAAGEPGLKPFLNCLAALAVAGVSVDPTPLFAGRDVQPIDPASPPHIDPPATAWMVNGQRARPVSGELPDFAMRPVVAPVATARDRLRGTNERDATVLEYLHSMREMVADQKQVMLRYLGAPPSAETSAAQPEAAPRAQKQTEAPAVSTPARRDEKLNPMEVLIAIVSERTGYPKELLDPDLDLEANLGIDSIKRIEVLGALGEKLALGFANIGKRSEMIEKLASVKTLRGIATAFEERAKDGAASAEVGAEPPKKEPDLNRYVLSVEPLPAAVPNGAVLNGRQFALTDDGRGLAPRLAALLKSRGASVQILTGDELPTSVDGLVHLSPLAAQPSVDPRKALFGLAKQAVLNGASCVVAATALGGAFQNGEASPVGARWTPGIAGLLRAVALEWPDLRVRSVGLDLAEGSPAEAFDRSAADLLAEILSDAPCVEVGYKGGVRHGAKPVLTPVEAGAATPLELGLEHVVLVTGGARGITAAAALELARRYGCSLELVGRSPSPSPEESDVAACPDAPALRRLLVGRDTAHGARPDLGAIEVEIARIVNAREIRKNLETLKAALGERVRYHAVDVRDRVAFGSLIDEIYARHGRLDGVIHGAGVIEDKLLRDKTRESFDRVFDTKVEGAQVLLDKLRPDVRFVVFFSSISGVFGNRGQVDYAAANDALDKLAHQLRRKVSGRVVSIGWGPWAGAGMMSKELEKEYERRGIGVIRPEEGVLRLIDEVVKGSQTQVILMRATPERLLAGPAPAGSE